MALGNGVFFSHGISFGATLQGDVIVPVFPTRAADAMRFILLVDGSGNAIVPEVISAADGIDLGEGRVGGIKYAVASAAELVDAINRLETRLDAIEALIDSDGSVTRVKNPQGDTGIVIGQFAGAPTLKFYQDSAPASRATVSLSSPTLAADLSNALASAGLVVADP